MSDVKASLRRAVEADAIRAWSNPAPNVWYIDTGYACPQMDDEYIQGYVKMLNDSTTSTP